MMMAGPKLRVVLATIHLPLADVPAALTEDGICETARITARALTGWFGVDDPRIAIAALNPHAGEGGRFGREEIDIIGPAVQKLQAEGLAVTGPHPADAVMPQAAGGRYDVVIAMYHDQGLAPVKTLHFDDAVNVTLGLPRPRTSPDHGTALDIAGQGIARHQPMAAALRMASMLAARSRAG
jgi:4-hydroxythreonine-4-phosphate dehydrogenase